MTNNYGGYEPLDEYQGDIPDELYKPNDAAPGELQQQDAADNSNDEFTTGNFEDDDADEPSKALTRRRLLLGLTGGLGIAAGGLAITRIRDREIETGVVNTNGNAHVDIDNVPSLNVDTSAVIETVTADTLVPPAEPVEGLVQGQQVLNGAKIAGAAPVDQRILVVIELQGGSDGLSLLVPRGSGPYNDGRRTLAIGENDLIPIDDEIGLHPSLQQVSKLGVTTVEGVGAVDANLSHFKMQASWERGDVASTKEVSSGFCGRVADAVNLSNGFAGVSVAGKTDFFAGGRIPALFMNKPEQLGIITSGQQAQQSFRTSAEQFKDPIGSNWTKLSEMGAKFSGGIGGDQNTQMVRRGKELGQQLAMAAELIKADVGVKVIYANLFSFDTHKNQERRLRFLWEEFDYAVSGFFKILEAAGLSNRVLLATTSEFGRRLKLNRNGTDHGAASNLIMVGPMAPRRMGLYPSLTNLDGDGNLKTEVPFDQYYATLCKDWMGVEPGLILPNDPKPLGLI